MMLASRSSTARVASRVQQQRGVIGLVRPLAPGSATVSPKQRAVEARIFGGDNKGGQ